MRNRREMNEKKATKKKSIKCYILKAIFKSNSQDDSIFHNDLSIDEYFADWT